MGPSKPKHNSSSNASISHGMEQIVFLLPEDCSEPTDKMQLAYDAYVRVYPDEIAIWKNAKHYNSVPIDTAHKVFVSEKFTGNVFDTLKKNKARIFGPLFILECCENDTPITTKQNLIYSAVMKGLFICCTNMSSELRKDLQTKVQLMGGLSAKGFTKDVTHLVAGEVGSKKYHVACNCNVPVMLPDWINECWRLTQNEAFNATDKRFDRFLCPIFKGLTVTVSQLHFAGRKEIQGLIETNGGIYSGELKVGNTTHLILREKTGMKFKVAERNQIFCVTASWVYDSFAKGFCIDENLYTLDGCVKGSACASTPTRPDETALKDLSCASSILSKTVNETVTTKAFMLGDIDKNDVENALHCQAALEDQTLLRKLEMCKHTSGLFLDGCKIMLSGFSQAVNEKLRKILNTGGATRFNQLNENVSHVILGDKMDENHKSLLEGNYRPHIVNINWLFESINSGKPVDEADFQCLKIQTKMDPVSPFSKSNVKLIDSTNQPNYSSFTNGCASKTDALDDEVMSQYVSGFQDDAVKIFQGYSFVVLGFDEEDDDLFKSVITENGGILGNDGKSDVDFALVPINGHSKKVHAHTTVTNYWMQSCLENESLQEVATHPLFSPISIDLTTEPLSGCVFSLSQFCGSERECLVDIIQLLGGRFQECLSRKISEIRGLLVSTHLIVKSPEGSKYIGARNWGLHIVNFKWLLACATANEKVDEAPYFIGKAIERRNNDSINMMQKQSLINESMKSPSVQQLDRSIKKISPPELNSVKKDDNLAKARLPSDSSNTPVSSKISFKTPTSTLRNSITSERILQIKERIKNGYQTPLQPCRIKELLLNDVDSSLNSSCDSPGLNTPSKFLNPDANVLPKFDIRDAMATLESPLQQNTAVSSRRSLNLPLEEVYIAKVNQALRYEIETTGGIVPNRSMDDLLEDTSKSMILSDVVVVVSKKLMHKQSELNKLTELLGGRYRWKYDKACTHFVHQGKASEYNKDLKVVQGDGKIIVSPDWLFACQQKQIRVEEHLYPYTYNRQLVLDVLTHKDSCPSSSRVNVHTVTSFDQSPFIKIPSPINSKLKKLSDSIHEKQLKASKIMETANKQMDEIFAATKIAKDKRTTGRPNLSTANSAAESRSSTPLLLRSLSNSRKNSNVTEVSVDHWAETLDSGPISWDDPTSRLERERLASHLSKDSQCLSQVDDLDCQAEQTNLLQTECLDKCEDETAAVQITSEPQKTPVMRFLLAGLKTQERQQISDGIKNIGGCQLESAHFDPSCTHLIIGFLNRTEKCLSAIASGTWVMRPSYIYECKKAGQILKPEDHEWASDLPNLSEEQKTFAKASRRWRIHLQHLKSKSPEEDHPKIGAFQDWKVIVYSNSQREESFRRLLEAGAAQVVSSSPPFSNVDGVTHAILELSRVQSPNIDMLSLLSAGVHCIKPDYIAQFLLEESPANIRTYYIPEVLPLLETQAVDLDSTKRKSVEEDGNCKRNRQEV